MGVDIFVPDCFLGLGNFYIKRRNMTKEEIIAMAQEAQMPFYWRTGEITYLDKLERFAALVASAEREACAKLIETTDLGGLKSDVWLQNYTATILNGYAKAIRARGQA